MADIKSFIKAGIARHIDSDYQLNIKNSTLSYDRWIEKREEGLKKAEVSIPGTSSGGDSPNVTFSVKYEGVTLRIVPYSFVTEKFRVSDYIEDLIVFTNGRLSEIAIPLIAETFAYDPHILVAYGDEDLTDEEGRRTEPFFKPDWSPNTFLDRFYWGNLVAIKRCVFRQFDWSIGYTGAASIYHTMLRFLFTAEKNMKGTVAHIPHVLIHSDDHSTVMLKDEKAARLAERMVTGSEKKISVIIPSKDNPELLEKCLTSLYTYSGPDVEIETIIVDNGSSDEHRMLISELGSRFGFEYIYDKMDFNFARMCNIGASKASSDILIFMNDDVTLTAPDTIELMLKEVCYKFTGAVGAKLLYPDSSTIQHAGVFNNRIGPVHKLQYKDDRSDYYYGFNRTVNNVLAVTAAFLMVRKTVYDEVGGMNEDLRVAFNDVDLCFKIYEAGYYNTVLNNTWLYHAESVTRGRDTDRDKLMRLSLEKERLYDCHQELKNADPFYGPGLVMDSLDTRFVPASEYEFERVSEKLSIVEDVNLSGAREEQCVILGIEYEGLLKGYTYNDTLEDPSRESYYIQGYSYVQGSDNACYSKKLILYCEERQETLGLYFDGALRSDVKENCPDEINVERSGFSLIIPKGMLKTGTYRIGILLERRLSREKLYKFSNNYIEIKF